MAINISKDIVSASTDRLEPLPWSQPSGEKQQQTEKEWLEEMTEKADRSNADPEIQFSVGQHHFLHQNYPLALKYFEKAAGVEAKRNKKGSSSDQNFSLQAKYQLGVMYYDGLGVKEDHVKGSEFMVEVAQSEEKKNSNIIPSAQYNIGRAYFMGYGVTQSDDDAEKWWSSAGGLGNDSSSVRANHTLGLFYSRQESLNAQEAFKWHSKAAECKNLESMAAVGMMLIHGHGCTQNQNEGVNWLKSSALLGQPAQSGCLYGRGLLSRQYYVMKLFSKAAETALSISGQSSGEGASSATSPLTKLDCMGVATGCFVLARCLQLGQAVIKNQAEAMVYYEKAKQFDMKVVADMHDQLTHGKL